jgi:TorA maturation chaperone TorD
MSDTVTGHDAERRQLADGYAVLARCWREPTEDLVAAVEAGDLEGVLPGVRDVSLEALRAEHARLFVGPADPPCPPYESVYRDGDDGPGQVLGPSTRDVVNWYREYGVGLEPEWSDLPDHLATELEFAAVLLDRGETEACERFLDEHPRRWFDDFATRLRESDASAFYRELLETTAAAIENGHDSPTDPDPR